ncbi:sulfite exporter TauE/SafE family protein [Chlorobaculum sp. MV4-Y]|uniref:sulfite exporter TauE/SafE family protein n=1 Tax=Chlorobaculum sp. MV4-Y TaxID=2976335 RepID=UPI0021AEE4A5|nr:sulfite exporter TauE/SafE family protein [Chlorobaculum sp. MV4-Y]UWX57234.1 sulfite exporter TauE/SafE family protein [Chlorobaculum sp. MV4-Y]
MNFSRCFWPGSSEGSGTASACAGRLLRRCRSARPGWPHHLLYNLGRVTTYTVLGAAVGATGSFLSLASSIDLFQTAVMALCGLFIVLLGLASAGWLPFGKSLLACTPAMPFVQKTMNLFINSGSAGAWYPLGLALGFLPCGLTFTALLAAARAAMNAPDHFAGMVQGVLMMLLFGLGTAPALLVVGKTAALIGEKTRQRLYRLASLIMIATGCWFIYSAFRG